MTSLGIYFFIRYKTSNEKIAFFCGLGYLTTLSISYYWISTGNLPYFFALWTIPFALFFLEKSIAEKKKKDFILFSLIFTMGILTHIVVGFLIGLFMIIRFLFEGFNLINLRKIFLYGIVPVLLASFWFVPFLFYSASSGGYEGYIPKIIQLFGFKDNLAWGLQAGGIGLLAFLFIFSLLFIKKYLKDKIILPYIIFVFILGFFSLGGLGSHYPLGVDPVRFVLPLSITLSLFFGLFIHKTKLFNNRFWFICFLAILIFGIIWNLQIVNKNFERFSYYKEDSRYQIFQNIISQENFPLKNKFENYRFGTSKFIFGENLNYFLPNVPQTFGYQDAGMLNAPKYYDMKWAIWLSDNISGAVYWLDWFGIKYFESENKDFVEKFKNDSRFKIVINYSRGYDFTLFEYLDAKQIISLVDYVNDSSFGREKAFSWKRDNPDKIIIQYDSVDINDVILFKEFYHKSWKAKELSSGEELEIKRVGPGFMAVYPHRNSKGIVFYQTKTPEEIFGLMFSILGVIGLILILKSKKNI